MPDPVTGIVAGVGLIGSKMQSDAQKNAADRAAGAQTEAAAAGIAEQRRQFDRVQKLLGPYAQVGEQALGRQADIAGLSGPEAQQRFISGIEGSPIFQSVARQGEEAILQSSSATGGLRGGNVQGALAQFRPQLLNQFIDKEYGRLAGLTSIGQNAAAGVGNVGQNVANQVTGLYGQQGQAAATGALAQGQRQVDQYGNIEKIIGTVVGGF